MRKPCLIELSQRILGVVAAFAICGFTPILAQQVELRAAAPAYMPAPVDSNSPAYWYDGQYHLLNSANIPLISSGSSQFYLDNVETVGLDRTDHIPMWIEASHMDADSVLYAWYHHEIGGLCPGTELAVPQIGALVSRDGGRTFEDLGIVLRAGDKPDCASKNGFFASGHGDFSVTLDARGEYFYFYISNYSGPASSQGVAVARMKYSDRMQPNGKVWKYFAGGWEEPGDGGQVAAIMPANVVWQSANADAFWGPSIHWNTYLNSYVMLLNHACCQPRWPQEGIYMSLNQDLTNPRGWTTPVRILKDIGFGPGFYPQVLGTARGETDKVAGRVARLYIHGVSKWELVFPAGAAPVVQPAPEPEPVEPQVEPSEPEPPTGPPAVEPMPLAEPEQPTEPPSVEPIPLTEPEQPSEPPAVEPMPPPEPEPVTGPTDTEPVEPSEPPPTPES